MGYAVCPEISVQTELAEGSLSKLRWGAVPFETSIIMIWHIEKWCSPLLKHFMILAEEIISGK
jgi:hypothetical protein